MPPTQTKQASNAVKSPAFQKAFDDLWMSYSQNTASRLKLIDGFLVFIMFSGIFQFLYFGLVTDYPFNAFISGFASAVGQFVLTASFRAQVNPANKASYQNLSPERAFADFVFGSLVLHFFVYNFLG